MTTPKRWLEIDRVFAAALEREPAARTAFLDEACTGDEQLRAEVESLLAYDVKSFAGGLAVEEATRALVRAGIEGPTPEVETIGPYQIIRSLGEGGMGHVYLAHDGRLNRFVAVKLLAKYNAVEEERLRRFRQEARAVSALNHPNIVTIHEIGENNGKRYIVTEYVEGMTLLQRIANAPQKQLRLSEALEIAAQVASALQAAHAAGIIHRDIKPANIIIRADGLLKVLDFGIAKYSEQEAAGPTNETAVKTVPGTVVGTAAYMSPEQARGQKVDHRTDLFSLGVVLYEMLAGQRPFEGETPSDLIAAVLTNEPASLTQVVPEIPIVVQRTVRRCLEKLPERRFQSAGDLAFALEEMSALSGQTAALPHTDVRQETPKLRGLSLGRLSWMLATGVLLLIALALAVIHWREQPEEKLATAFTIAAPEGWSVRDSSPAVSPDGRYIAFTAMPLSAQAGQASALWIRRLDSTESTTLAGTEGAYVNSPFWSPDSTSIAFWADGRIRRVDISGGPAMTLCETVGGAGARGTWNQQGTLLFRNGSRLARVASTGGQAITLNPFADGETGQANPRFLPDGKHFLYFSQNQDPQNDGIYVESLEPGERRKLVLKNAGAAIYVSLGYLLFNRDAVVFAQQFDLKRLEVTGDAVRVAGPIDVRAGALQLPWVPFSASETGVLVWHEQSSVATQLTWFDQSGKRLGTVGEPGEYSGPALSPDEDRLAVARLDLKTKTRDLWIMNLLQGGSTRLTFDPEDDFNPVWSPDGKWIIFTSTKKGDRSIYRKLADGTGEMEPLLESEDPKHVEDISSDGRFLIFNSRPAGAPRPDIFVLSLTEDRKRTEFLNTSFWEDSAQFSPNGRWVAYRSNETDNSEVFVRGFATDGTTSTGKWQVSKNSGSQPRWRGDGKEIFYLQGNTLMAAAVNTENGSFSAGTPKPLFNVNVLNFGRNSFVVTRDGQRFLVISASAQPKIAVKTNWMAELKR